jgi:hypothetical protein
LTGVFRHKLPKVRVNAGFGEHVDSDSAFPTATRMPQIVFAKNDFSRRSR